MTTEELQTLLDAATPGPLEVSGHHIHTHHGYIVAHCPNSGRHDNSKTTTADAEGMSLWPAIAAELIAARAKLAAAEGLVAATLKFREFAADHSMTSEVMPFDNLAARELSAALTAWEAVK